MLSTPCFAGIATLLDAMSTYQMSRPLSGRQIVTFLSGSPPSEEANGSTEAGHFKSFLRLTQSNSFPSNASDLAIKIPFDYRYMRQLAF
jgi:hypothetical protein